MSGRSQRERTYTRPLTEDFDALRGRSTLKPMSADDNDPLLYPPVPRDEFRSADGYDKIGRVVETQNGVWSCRVEGSWVQFEPLSATGPNARALMPTRGA